MSKFLRMFLLVLGVVGLLAAPAAAQGPEAAPATAQGPAGGTALINFPATFGAALIVIGAALGIGKLAAAALESMARQPEVAGNIQTAMIIAAALIEGFTFFALVICFLVRAQ